MGLLKRVRTCDSGFVNEETHWAFTARHLVRGGEVEIDMSTPVLVGCPKYDVTSGHTNTAPRAANDLV